VAYLKPSPFVRNVFNPLAMRFGIGGAVTLVVPRRRSGEPQRIPVMPVEHDGGRYIVSVRGESDWVKNMRAAGGGELHTARGAEPFRATEIPVEQREPIIAVYRPQAGKGVAAYWKKLPAAADHPVFRIEPAA
jgi:deazaflavin-dependent oxidoreductase (nitroreductase family)